MRDTQYAKEIATAKIGQARVECIYVKEAQQNEIRFSWWKDGNIVPRALDLPEEDLLDLIAKGIRKGVFTDKFVLGLARVALSEVRT